MTTTTTAEAIAPRFPPTNPEDIEITRICTYVVRVQQDPSAIPGFISSYRIAFPTTQCNLCGVSLCRRSVVPRDALHTMDRAIGTANEIFEERNMGYARDRTVSCVDLEFITFENGSRYSEMTHTVLCLMTPPCELMAIAVETTALYLKSREEKFGYLVDAFMTGSSEGCITNKFHDPTLFRHCKNYTIYVEVMEHENKRILKRGGTIAMIVRDSSTGAVMFKDVIHGPTGSCGL